MLTEIFDLEKKIYFFNFCNTGLDLGLLWTESKAKLKNSSIQKRKSRHKIHQNFMKFNENLMRRAFNSNSYLFPSALIRENRMKSSKSLPALKGFLLTNGINTGKKPGNALKVDDFEVENFESPTAFLV